MTFDDPQAVNQQNENAYEDLVTAIDSSEGIFAPLIAVCDDRALRQRLIGRYEQELLPDVRGFRLQLNRGEPSLRAALAQWVAEHQEIVQRERRVVLTVTGAEELLWINLRGDDPEKPELEKFFGYLQWTREGMAHFHYPIVLWVTHRILRLMTRRAPDFWSWRKEVFRFESEIPPTPLFKGRVDSLAGGIQARGDSNWVEQ